MFNKKTIKDVLALALPAVGEMILYMMIWVLDTVMVGKYGGKIAVSTVGLSSEIMYTFVNIFITFGISIGVSSLVARRLGAKNLDSAEEYATLGFITATVLAFFISLCTFLFSKNILTIGGAKGDVLYYGMIFMKITSFGIFFNMLTNAFNAILRGSGNTKTPLLVSVIINIINISLDWVLIFGRYGFPELGIKGSAIATATAQTFGFIFICSYITKKSKIKIRLKYIYRFDYRKLKELWKLSIPSSLQEAAFDIARLLGAFIIMHVGNIAFAANQIATTIESLSFMPGWGFSVAATTLVGHNIGKRNMKSAKEYAYTSTALGVITMAACAILFLTAPHFLIKLFINESEKEVIYFGSLCIMAASAEQIPMAMSMIFGGSLKGAGNTKTPFIISLISGWLIRLPLMYYFIYTLKFSVVYVWWITAIQWLFEGAAMLIMFKRFSNRLEHNL